MVEKTYPLKVESGEWDDIKGTVPSNQDLNDTVVERIKEASFSPRLERTADGRGRISLPTDEYAEKEIEVLVVDVRDPEEAEDE